MVKKITALALCIVMLFSMTGYAATFTDVASDGTETAHAINVLSELGIISGMGDGTFSPYTSLTRAQFAKIAVCIMGKTKEAVATTDAFSDVKSTDWYSGYVNVVASEGIITGYPDGSFGADDAVTYAQAITIIVRLLGYDATDVGHKWPQGYIDKAAVLGLTEGMYFSANDVINRQTAAVLIYRALFTDMKNTKTALITKMDKNVYEDVMIVATNNENASLLMNQVQSSQGTFTFEPEVADMAQCVGYEGTLVVNDDAEVIAFVENDGISKSEYTVSAIYQEGNSDNISVICEDGNTVLINSKTTMYMEGNAYTAQKLTEGLNAGSTITFFNENGSLKYIFAEEYKNQGPVTVLENSNVKTLFDIENPDAVRVIRKGVTAAWEDIEVYDVLYYSERTNTIYAYCDRVTGMYEEAYPMKSNVSKVTVSGKEYTLSTLAVVNKLNESEGAFKIGERVTLLFGEDGNVVDAVKLNDTDFSMYGVIVSSGSELSDDADSSGRAEYYVNVKHTDGSTVKYTVEDDSYEDRAGELCIVDFENSYAYLSFPAKKTLTGTVNREANLIGEYKIASDIAILDYVDGNDTVATVSTAKLIDIDGITLNKTDVKQFVLNKKGEIALLYLNNVTGNSSVYGVIVEVPDSGDKSKLKTGTFTVLSGNTKYTFNTSSASYQRGGAVEYYKGVSETTVTNLIQVASGQVIEACNDNVIEMNDKNYILADNATVYVGKNVSELKAVSWKDAVGVKGSVTLYSDRLTREGGKVRVIIIYTN